MAAKMERTVATLMMASLAALITVSSSFASDSVSVNELKAPRSIVSVVPVTGRLSGVESACPPNARCLVATYRANIELELGSCVNSLGPITTTTFYENGKAIIYVSGVEFVNEKADDVHCFRQETRMISVSTGTSADADVRFVGDR